MNPNMLPEIIEAVQNYFKEDEDVLVDCMLYLKNLKNNKEHTNQLSSYIVGILEDMKRCPNCGTPLEWYHYQEPHTELDGCPMEDMYEPYCPNCNYPAQMKIRGV